MRVRLFFAVATLLLFSTMVCGQQVVRNTKKEQAICDRLAARTPAAWLVVRSYASSQFARAEAVSHPRQFRTAMAV
jgi:hypothetical protein